MKALTYTSLQKLGCGCPPVDVILCVDPAVTVDNIGFMNARLISMDCGNSPCGQTQYSYDFTYSEGDLLDPNVDLQACDISGVFCDSCMAAYIRWRTSPFTTVQGDPYTYVLPAGPPPMAVGDPFALDIVSVIGFKVTLGWHVITPSP